MQHVSNSDDLYHGIVPRLWNETIEAHRRDVREAILDTAAALAQEEGLRSVTMSQIAEQTGIGRATLYKYFPDVEAILRAWHERQIGSHFAELTAARDATAEPLDRLRAVLEAFAFHAHERLGRHDTELAAFFHGDEQVAHAQQQLQGIVRDLVKDAVAAGAVRADVSPDELTSYCVNALLAARTLPSKAAVRRLVALTLDGMRSGMP